MHNKTTVQTARQWLYKLEFEQVSSKKEIFIDNHKKYVAQYRKLHLRLLETFASMHASPDPCSDDLLVEPFTLRKLVLIFYDEYQKTVQLNNLAFFSMV